MCSSSAVGSILARFFFEAIAVGFQIEVLAGNTGIHGRCCHSYTGTYMTVKGRTGLG